MKLTKVVVLSAAAAAMWMACSDDSFRHTPDGAPAIDGAIDAAPDAPLAVAMLSGSPGDTDFGDVVIGQTTSTVTYTISNDGEQASGTVGVIVDPAAGAFALSANTCSGVSLAKHETCTFAIAFTPSAAGLAMATVHIAATPGGEITRNVMGNGLQPGALDIIEASHDYTSLAIDGTPTTHTFQIKNTGQVATGMPMPTISGTPNTYAIASTTCSSALAPNATCNVVVRFDPATVGSKPGSLVVTATPGGADSATLSGIGIAHVAVTKTGNGTGTVTSNMSGIDCGSGCTADFSATPVNLTAAPGTGASFTGWTGDCTGTGPCTLDLTAGKAVGAVFTLQRFTLTTATAGNGAGTVGLAPAGGTYNYGTMVTVTAAPATGSTFTGWSGDCSGTGACTVSMTQARNVTATFTLDQYALTTATTGTGTGTLALTPAGGTYDYGTMVTVTPNPAASSDFAGWSGDCTGTGACTVTMTQARSVTARFTLKQFTLTTSKTGNGTGAVGGAGTYNYGTVVTVTESAGTGSTFGGWGGDCSGTGACTVTMTANHAVSAAFNLQQFTLTTSTTGTGTGTIGGGGTYNYGTVVTVTESPATSSNFTGWGGDCSGTGACTVTMTANHAVSAAFTLKQFTLTTSTTGNGTGSVGGAGTYNYGTVVTVTESPATSSNFTGWGGDCSGTGACTVTMTANHTVSAAFTLKQFTLTTSTSGNGTGTVGGAGTYNYGTVVTVTESPATSSNFTGWGGDCSGTGACTVTMTANHAVSADFTLKQFTLTTSTNGTGSGTVGGAGTYNYGAVVTLTESPAGNSSFAGWGGDCSGTGPCQVTMTANHAVSATFNVLRFTLTTSTTGTGSGTVGGAGTYVYGTVVTVTESPATGSTFTGWGGDCSGANGCQVTMTANHAVSANFDAIPETLTVSASTGGKIVSTPSGISCSGATCAHDFDYGTPVTLDAVLDPGYQVAAVSGDCTSLPCTVTMDQARNVSVRIAPQRFNLSLSFLGDVASSGSITIGTTTYTANTNITVQYGSVITLSAFPGNSDITFAGWGGACSSNGTNPSCTITITGNTSVSGTWLRSSYRYTLTATTATPNGLAFSVTYPPTTGQTAECQSTAAGQACFGSLRTLTVVQLTAHAAVAGVPVVWNNLPKWTGCDKVSADQLTCTFVVNATRAIDVIGDMRVGP